MFGSECPALFKSKGRSMTFINRNQWLQQYVGTLRVILNKDAASP